MATAEADAATRRERPLQRGRPRLNGGKARDATTRLPIEDIEWLKGEWKARGYPGRFNRSEMIRILIAEARERRSGVKA